MAEVKAWLAVGTEKKKKEREKQYHGSSMVRS